MQQVHGFRRRLGRDMQTVSALQGKLLRMSQELYYPCGKDSGQRASSALLASGTAQPPLFRKKHKTAA